MYNESYTSYKAARDMAWKVLIDCKINSLPLKLGDVSKHYGIQVKLFSESRIIQLFRDEVLAGDGFSVIENGQKMLYINDKIHNRYRRRFTYAHELGHLLMNHNIDIIKYRNLEADSDSWEETSANVFARDLLAPAIVLKALDIHTPEQIMDLCHISITSAKIRAKRMEELYKRDKFLLSSLEQKVYEQFKDFINSKK